MSQAEDLTNLTQQPEDFPSKQDVIRLMIDACALWPKETRTKKSDKARAYFRCTIPWCEFCCLLNKGGDGLFHVSKLVWHTCWPLDKVKVKRLWFP